ncbi:PAS domain-containing protein [Alsobacter sp. R-9]
MKHAATRELYAYWDRVRGDRLAPERAEIDPTAIRSILADCFMLEVDAAGRYPFMLAGTRLCALVGRELKDESFASLWQRADGTSGDGAALVRTVCDETQGAVAGVLAATVGGHDLDLEMLLLPLRHGGKTHARVLGCLSPASIPSWFGLSPVDALALRSFRVIRGRPGADSFGPIGGTPTRLSVLAQRRGHLRVFEGGAIQSQPQA